MDRYKFGEFIYQKRKALGLTQEELGRKLGVTNKAVSKWEVGETTPDITVLEPLANLFQVTVDELLTGKEQSVENKKKVKLNKLLLIFVIILVSLELLTIIGTVGSIIGINLYYQAELNKKEHVLVDIENVEEYVEVLPMTGFTNDGQEIVISSLVKPKKEFTYKNPFGIGFEITYKISYYYYDTNNKIGVVTYSRDIMGELSDVMNEYEVQITLFPKTEIANYAYLKNVVVEYEINSVSGEIILE